MKRGTTVAGKYRLNQPLGSGGMAEVWSATNTFTERQVAIKFMNPEIAKTPEAAARFLKEAKVSARVNHPNIIDILDVGQTEEQQLFLVMELLAGSPLDAAMRRHSPPMTVHQFVLVMIEVAEALAAAHRAGIVHRDLKPSNIFLQTTKDGAATKLLDFGVSKFLEEDTNHALTVAGTVLGSPLYMSPEQARGETNLDGRTDIFAFGAILFEALCGYRAYEAKNFNALIVKIATTKPKSIDACAPHVPDSLRRVVRACMETSLEERIHAFEHVLTMLRQALPDLDGSAIRLATPLLVAAGADAAEAAQLRPTLAGADTVVDVPSSSGARSWQTPHTSYASVVTVPPPKRAQSWLAFASAALAVAGIAFGAVHASRARAATAVARAPEPVVTVLEAPKASPVLPAPEPKSDVPTVSVDALPGARSTTTAAPAKGYGRLHVVTRAGACALRVDGKEQGSTPAVLDLSAGPHQLACRAASGKARTATVVVAEGTSSTSRFTLDD